MQNLLIAPSTTSFLESNDNIQQAFYSAIRNGQKKAAELLMVRGANIESRDFLGRTPMHIAALCGHEKIIRLLARHNANIQACDYDDRTPLHLAVRGNHITSIETLISAGASANIQDITGKTALSWITDLIEQKSKWWEPEQDKQQLIQILHALEKAVT